MVVFFSMKLFFFQNGFFKGFVVFQGVVCFSRGCFFTTVFFSHRFVFLLRRSFLLRCCFFFSKGLFLLSKVFFRVFVFRTIFFFAHGFYFANVFRFNLFQMLFSKVFFTGTGKPSSKNQQENHIKRDRVANSQERREDSRARATTGSPRTRAPSQSTEDTTTCTGRSVPTIESRDAGSASETKEECNILSARSTSLKENVDERLRTMPNCLPGKEMIEGDRNSVIWRIFMTSSMHAAIFLLKELLRENALHPNHKSEANCTEIVRRDSNTDPRTRIGDARVVRNERSCTWQATRGSSSSSRQKFMYSPTRYCVWENA